jgi:hypothetical protein
MKKMILIAALMMTTSAPACELSWDYPDDVAAWLSGFRVYQAGAQVGEAAADARSGDCAALGLVPGPGPITMTAWRDNDESPQSEPSTFELLAPGVQVRFSIQ